MELLFEATFHTYQITSLFSLATTGKSDILAEGNASKERDTWKGKCEAMKQKYSTFQK